MKGMKSFGKYGAIGFEIVLSMGVGYYLGLLLDRRLDTHFIAYIGFAVGVYAGFRALFRAGKEMQRDIEREEALERGEDPWAPKDAEEPEEKDGQDPPKPGT